MCRHGVVDVDCAYCGRFFYAITQTMFDDCRGCSRTRSGYTQNLEEPYIQKYARGSRFLDIGAYDGQTFSSTKALVEKGWTGVYVEPNPLILDKLYDVAKQSGSVVLPVAIGTTCGTLPFYANSDMISSLDKRHRDIWATNNRMVFDTVQVDVIDVKTLASRVGTEFDVLNLDVEGINWEIFEQFDWSVWKFNVVCIEYDSKFEEMKKVLEAAGFTIRYASPENIVASR